MLNKMPHTILAMLLVCCLLLGLSGNAIVLTASAVESGTYNYVSLGASQTNGYGLQGYLPITVDNGQVSEDQLPLLLGLMQGQISKDDINVYGYQRVPEGGYPDLVRDALEEKGYEVNVDQLAISSMRAEELRMLLDNDYYGDSYTEWRFYDENGNGWFSSAAKEEGMTNAEALAALRGEYQNAIAGADLVTVDIGVNNFGVYAINRIDSGLDDPNNAKYDADITDVLEGEDLEQYYTVRAMVDMLVESYVGDVGEEGQASVDFMVDTFAYALVGFCVNFDKSMEAIYALNPDATVVIVSIQNLLEGMTARIPGVEGEIPLDSIYGTIVDIANLYTAAGSPYSDRYYYAAAGDVSLFLDDILEYDGNPESLNQDMRDCFGLYDNDLFGWELYLRYAEYPGVDVSAGTDAVYGALAEIAKACAEKNVLDFGDLATMDDAEDALGDFIEQTLEEAFVAGMSGQEYTLDTAVLENPDYASAMAIAIRLTLGNSFFAHPNRTGHQERADAILAAIENETRGAEVAEVEVANYLSMITGEDAKTYTEATHGDYTVTENSYYVSLGDSTVTGMNTGDPNYGNYGYKTKVPTSFPYQVAQELGLNVDTQYSQMAMAGLRLPDLRYILDETFIPDEYTLIRTKDRVDSYAGGFEQIRADYIAELSKADLITISIGSCHFSDFISAQLDGALAPIITSELSTWLNNPYIGNALKVMLSEYVDLSATPYEMDWESYVGADGVAELEVMLADVRAELIANNIPEVYKLDIGEMTGMFAPGMVVVNIPMADLAVYMVECYLYGYTTLVMNYEEVFDKIHEIAPDAQLLIVSMYNPNDELVIMLEDVTIPMGELTGQLMEMLNLHYLTYAMTTPNTTFVPAYDTESNADLYMAENGSEYDLFEYIIAGGSETDAHATVDGHIYIKDQIITALTPIPEWDGTARLGDVDGDGDVDATDASWIRKYDAEMIGSSALNLSVADVDDDGDVDATDAAWVLKLDAELITVLPGEAK